MATHLSWAYETGKGGMSGGHAFCMREGQAAYKIHQIDFEGSGFLASKKTEMGVGQDSWGAGSLRSRTCNPLVGGW